jgi:LysM repeat protein
MKRRLVLVAITAAVLLALVPAAVEAAPAQSQQSRGVDCSWYYMVRWGDTLADIAWRYGVSKWSIARVNGINNINRIYAGQWLLIPCTAPARPCYHNVRWGETLADIAWHYGISMWSIASANGIANVNRIYAGQWLVIPGCWW